MFYFFGIALVAALVIVGGLILFLSLPSGSGVGAAAPAPASAGAGAGAKLAKFAPWIIGGTLALVVLVFLLNSSSAKGAVSTLAQAPVWVATILLLALVVLGIMGKGGEWTKRIAGLGALFLVLYVAFHFLFGDKSDFVADKLRENAVKLVTEKSTSAEVPLIQLPALTTPQATVNDELGVIKSIILSKGEETRDIRVYGTQCLSYHGRDPSGHAFETYVREVNGSKWYTMDEFRAGRAPFKAPAWYKFRGLEEEGAEVNYTILKRGECGEK